MRASLPMYDLPELHPATDAWWAGVARALRRGGLAAVPAALDRTEPLSLVWCSPDLLLSQCCGRDLVTHLAGKVAPVAIPSYRAEGCSPGTYRSWLVARRYDARPSLADFVGATAAVNYTGSHSGWVALGHTLWRAGLPERCFARAVATGSHRASLRAVSRGKADLAAIDCVSFALLARVDPAAVGGLRIIAESEPAPALPYVTSAARPAEAGSILQALLDAAADPELAAARSDLLLDGFLPVEGDPYGRSMAMAAEAAEALDGLAAVLDDG